MTLSAQFFQPYTTAPGYDRGSLVYDPRGDSSPFLYGTGGAQVAAASSHVWVLNRRTGVITDNSGQFWNWPSFGPADMDAAGNLWWIGIEANNLTQAREAQTKFAADTLAKVGSMTSNGVTIVYPVAGQVRVDRHSGSNLVWQLSQGDAHSDHGDLYAWNNTTRIQAYHLTAASWNNLPVGGTFNRVWDMDPDASGNLWCISRDDTQTYTLLWKVTPSGVQTMIANLSAFFPTGGTNFPIMKWVQSDDTLVINFGSTLVKCQTSNGAVVGTGSTIVPTLYGENYQSFHNTIESNSVYVCKSGATGPVFYQINLLTLATLRTIDFAGVSGCVGVFWNGFDQAYDAARFWRPITCFYDPVLGGCWTGEFFQGAVGAFSFGDVIPAITCFTTGILNGRAIATLTGVGLGLTAYAVVSPTPNIHNGNAYRATVLSATATTVVVSVPNSAIAQMGYWFVVLTDGTESVGVNQFCSGPGGLFTIAPWKTRKVWFETLEP